MISASSTEPTFERAASSARPTPVSSEFQRGIESPVSNHRIDWTRYGYRSKCRSPPNGPIRRGSVAAIDTQPRSPLGHWDLRVCRRCLAESHLGYEYSMTMLRLERPTAFETWPV